MTIKAELHERAFRLWAGGMTLDSISHQPDMPGSPSTICRWKAGSCACPCPWHKWDDLVSDGREEELDQYEEQPGEHVEAPEPPNPSTMEEIGDGMLSTEFGVALEKMLPELPEVGAESDRLGCAAIEEQLFESIRYHARWLAWRKIEYKGRTYYAPKVEPKSAKEAVQVMREVMALRNEYLRHKKATDVEEEEVATAEDRAGAMSDEELIREFALLEGGKAAG